jgi:hypothetical protein
MDEIQAVLEVRKREVFIRAWEWPGSMEVLRAYLRSTPSHPRAPVELLEALARWQGRRVHAAVVVGRSDGCSLGRLFPDLFEPEPTALVEVSFVPYRPAGAGVGCRPPIPSAWAVRQAELPFPTGGGR